MLTVERVSRVWQSVHSVLAGPRPVPRPPSRGSQLSPRFEGLEWKHPLAVAAHEAGHAIVGLCVGIGVTHVRLVREGGRLVGGYAALGPRDDSEAAAASCLRGPRAPLTLDAIKGVVLPWLYFIAGGPAANQVLGLSPRLAVDDRAQIRAPGRTGAETIELYLAARLRQRAPNGSPRRSTSSRSTS